MAFPLDVVVAAAAAFAENQEHENIPVHPDVTPKRNRKQRSRKNNASVSTAFVAFAVAKMVAACAFDDAVAAAFAFPRAAAAFFARAFDDAVAAAFAFPRAAAAFFARAALASAYAVFAAAAFFAVDFSAALTVTFFAADADDLVADVFAVSPSPSSSGDGSDDEFNQGVGESVDGRTSSGVGSDDKFNQGVGESVDGRTIGKLFVSNREIAKGSNDTIVLEGTHEVPVAVKRLVKAHHDVAYKEYQNPCVSDSHPNIVRLYGKESDRDYVYLAPERCTCSFNDLIQMQLLDAPTTSGDRATEVNSEYRDRLQSMKGTLPEVKLREDNGYPSPMLRKLMRDVVSRLVHLHELGMVHRDLKPQNVLIVKEKRSLCAKLADMGISKRLVEDKSSLGDHATGCGSSGWQAPEQLLNQPHQTPAVDVFSFGLFLFYCITGGKHPFGDDPLKRDINIVESKADLFLVEDIPEAVDLLSRLLNRDAELRPTASEVLIHPMFWDSDKRLSFFWDASDRVQREGKGSAILQELEGIAPHVLGTKRASWDKKIESLLNGIDNPRWYYYDRVRDLLRFIRNKRVHFHDLRPEIQVILGPVPEGFDGYFTNRFPKLLMEVYKVLHKHCREEEWCNKYFKGSVDCVV